ncbi:hypothetical protein [Sporocytophaga myxococcoides]|uniref:hypothetical protein n=1 Tax=Sporocytophaga myxococcoides TaxID=153721 RepID=UPI00049120CB|nr:hypothetical protein [Sporocytophaga myxococcoides]
MEVGYSISKAEQFLFSSTGKFSLWNDFHTLAGKSSEWVSCYVLSALLSQPMAKKEWMNDMQIKLNLLKLRDFLRVPKGYNFKVPADADSSAWYLSVLTQVGSPKNNDRIDKLICFLNKHRTSDGGFSTFHSGSPIRNFIKASPLHNMDGWQQSHACVAPFVIMLLSDKERGSQEYILRNQKQDGYWASYWWTDDLYSTFLNVQCLASLFPEEEKAIAKGKDWCRRQFVNDSYIANFKFPFGSAFTTALGISTLLQGIVSKDDIYISRKASEWLIDSQLSEGNWQPSALLRIPFPDCIHPGSMNYSEQLKGGGALCIDEHTFFTTATVMRALKLFHQRNLS